MLANVLVLIILCIAVYVIAKTEKAVIQNWLDNGRSEEKANLKVMYLFWNNVVRSPIRVAALLVTLVCQRDVFGMLFSIFVLLGISYFLARMGILLKIRWRIDNTENAANVTAVALAIFWLIDALSWYSYVTIAVLVAILIGIIYLVVRKKLGPKKTTEDPVVDYDDEAIEEGENEAQAEEAVAPEEPAEDAESTEPSDSDQ